MPVVVSAAKELPPHSVQAQRASQHTISEHGEVTSLWQMQPKWHVLLLKWQLFAVWLRVGRKYYTCGMINQYDNIFTCMYHDTSFLQTLLHVMVEVNEILWPHIHSYWCMFTETYSQTQELVHNIIMEIASWISNLPIGDTSAVFTGTLSFSTCMCSYHHTHSLLWGEGGKKVIKLI